MAGKLSHRLLAAAVVVSGLLAVWGTADVFAETVATPSFTPGGGTYNDEQSVVVTCATPGATIHYTVNGVDPTESDPAVEPNVPVFVEHSLTLKAKAWKDGLVPSVVRSTTYTLKVATPAFSKSTATYNMEQDVLVTCATPEATIHYTTSGIDPTESDPVIEPNVPILVDHSLTLKAKAWKGAMTPSNIRAATYALVVTTPTFLPGGGTYNSEQSIVVACSTPGATIHYRIGETTDANVVPSPTQSDPVIASGGQILVDHTQTIKFRAWKGELDASGIAVGTYYMVTAKPEITPSGGSYANELYATVTCATPGATIHYTTNGVDPTQSDPVITSGDSVYVDHSLVLKAKAWEGALAPSSVQARTYTLQVGRPSFQPGGGTYSSEQNVVITCVTAGATIHYTTNGVDPTESDPVIASGSSVYADHSLVLKAKAWKGSFTPSTVRSMTYTLQVAQPSFSPGGGTYNSEQNVVVTCTTPGATIHYTTNGLTPTESDPVIASGGSVYVDHSLTLKAKAWKSGSLLTPSGIQSATYTLVVATPVFDPNGGTYSSEQNVVVTCATPGATIHYTTNGLTPTESDPVVASGGSVYVDRSLTLKAKAWKVGSGLASSSIQSATYTLVVATPVFDPNGGTYSSEQNVVVTCATPGATIHYTTNGLDPNESDPVIASGDSIPVSVDPPTTLKAMGFKTNFAHSNVKAAVYGQLHLIHVSPDGSDISDGLSWITAKQTLQAALDVVISGDEIWVAAGTYYPTNDYGLGIGDRGKHFRMKNGVGMYGGFAGTETSREERNWTANETILSGDIGVQGDANDNVYHVLYHPSGTALDSSAVLDGFVITAGNANGSSPHDSGGGLYCIDSGPTISNCDFVRNKASSYGGGAADLSTGKLVMTSCTFLGNEGCGTAGVRDVRNCIYVGNTGIAAMYVDFWGTVYDNWQFAATNCTFVANPTYAAFADIGSYYAAFYTTNNIFWGNSYTYGDSWNGGGHWDHCYVQGWPPYPADPAFVHDPGRGMDNTWGTEDDDYGDLRLKVGSPCVDAGGNADANAPDLAGNPRVFDGNGDGIATVDIGAYERQCLTNPVGDVSYDCGVEFADYAMLMNRWGQSGCTAGNWWCYWADVDESGTVDIMDMAALVEHWLEGN